MSIYTQFGFREPESLKQANEILAFIKAARDSAVCRNCGNPATCYGTYENDTGYACDECCGHGCEDGHCERIKDNE